MSPPPFTVTGGSPPPTSTALPVGVAQAAQITQPVGVVTALPAAAADKPDTLHVGSNITPASACKPAAMARCMCCFWISPR